MALLILDLDLTTFLLQGQENLIHSAHATKSASLPAKGWDPGFMRSRISIKFINPKELTDLIQYAFTYHDGIMILTSGFWERESVLTAIKETLDLSPCVKVKLKKAFFHSPYTESDYYTKAVLPYEAMHYVQNTEKAGRLEAIIDKHKKLRHKAFVMFDDNKTQLAAFNKPVFTVHANTRLGSKDFYEEAKFALQEAQAYEITYLKENDNSESSESEDSEDELREDFEEMEIIEHRVSY